MYENYKVYGPYVRNDDRSHVILILGDDRITISYPKYLMELYLDRKLTESEVVHHIDENFLNNK